MQEQSDNVIEEKRDVYGDFEKMFDGERAMWKEKISDLSQRMRDIRAVGEVQIELFSSRQQILEYNFKLGQILNKLNMKFRKDKADRLRFYSNSTNSTQVRYGSNEKTPLIESDLSDLIGKTDLIDNHMSYLTETIKTIDHFLYGIKSRIQLEDFMRNGSAKNI